MTTASDYSDVFVSYRRIDVDFVKSLVEALRQQGKEVWIDWEDIPPGSVGFSDDIKRGLEGADTFICVLSPDYLESSYCVDLELNYAVTLKKKLIPVVYRKFDGYDIPKGIGHINWIYFTPHAGQGNTFEESFPKVIQAMQTDLAHVRNHKRFLLRAIEWDERGRAASYLLDGDEITAAETWLVDSAGKDPLPTDLHKDYVKNSRANEARRRRTIFSGVVVALVVTVVLMIAAVFLGIEANRQRSIAEVAQAQAEELAQQVQALFLANGAVDAVDEGDPFLALALVQRAIQHLQPPPPEVETTYASLMYRAGPHQAVDVGAEHVSSMAVSPDERWALIATCQSPGDVCASPQLGLWDTATWTMQQQLAGITGEVTATAFNAQSNWIAAAMCANGSDDTNCPSGSEIVVWNATSGAEISRWRGHDTVVTALTFSPDSRWIASGSSSAGVVLWSVERGQQLVVFPAHEGGVTGLAFTPDGRTLLSAGCRERGCDSSDLIVWDVVSGQSISQHENVAGSSTPLLIHPRGDLAIFGGPDTEIVLWDIAAGEAREVLRGHRADITNLWLNSAGDTLVSASYDRTFMIWNIGSDRPNATRIFKTGNNSIQGVGLINDSQRVVTGLRGSPTLAVWDLDNGAVINHFADYSAAWSNAAYSADGNSVILSTTTGEIVLMDALTGAVAAGWPLENAFAAALEFSPDGSRIAMVECANVPRGNADCERNWLRIRDRAGNLLQELVGQDVPIEHLAFSADGRYLIASAQDNSVLVWDTSTWTQQHSLTDVSSDFCCDIAQVGWLPDGSAFLAATRQGLLMWDRASGEPIRTFDSPQGPIVNFAVLPDGQRIATTHDGGQLVLWDIASGEPSTTLFIGSDPLFAIDATEDYLFTGSQNKVVMINSDTGDTVREYEATTRVTGVFASSDATRALSETDEGVLLWRIDSLDEMRAWAAENRYIPALPCEQALNYLLETECPTASEE